MSEEKEVHGARITPEELRSAIVSRIAKLEGSFSSARELAELVAHKGEVAGISDELVGGFRFILAMERRLEGRGCSLAPRGLQGIAAELLVPVLRKELRALEGEEKG